MVSKAAVRKVADTRSGKTNRPSQNPIRVMLSSRCLSEIELKKATGRKSKFKLSDLREEAINRIEAYSIGGRKIFAVWANEFAGPAALDIDSWEECVTRARNCDIFISLDASDAGWWKPKDASGLGICHEELRTAVESGRGKVRVVSLKSVVPPKPENGDDKASAVRNAAFADYKKREGLDPFVSSIDSNDTLEAAADKICDAVGSALIDLAIRGKQVVRQARNAAGEALDWARLDLVQRNDAMLFALNKALGLRSGAEAKRLVCTSFALTEVFSNSWAREQLGKPFLSPSDPPGALLVIACYRSFTEMQARTFFGHSAVMTVASDFGVFSRDLRTHAQVMFLKNCRDSASLTSRLQSGLSWIGNNLTDYEVVKERRLVLEKALGV